MTIYLDYNATSPLRPEVKNTMLEVMGNPMNPSSIHSYGREARSIIERARRSILSSLNAEGARIIFVSSGTEANHLALKGIKNITTVVSAIEHASVIKANNNSVIIPVDNNGVVKLDALQNILASIDGKALVSVMLANNETGVIQPVKEIVEITYAHGDYLHTDAVQGVGKFNINFNDLNVDMMTISSHKCGGPQGIAALIIKKGLELEPMLRGGGQEYGIRAGTENVSAIHGFALALEMAIKEARDTSFITFMRDKLENELEIFNPVIFGIKAKRLGNTSYIEMPGVDAETQVVAFDLDGIAVSSGSACTSGKIEASHVLKAMGVESSSAVRVSLGWNTKEKDIKAFVDSWKKIYRRVNQQEARAA